MKIFVPSKNRPDSKLFTQTTGLNIVLQTEQDFESYKIHEKSHVLHCKPELKGLLDTRNWILEQGTKKDPWIFMIDDDVNTFNRLVKQQKLPVILSFTKIANEIEKMLNKIIQRVDTSKIGIIGFNNQIDNRPFIFNFNDEFTIINENNFMLFHHSILLNTPVLKSINFQYSGYPFDGQNGQRAFFEDTELNYFLYVNGLNTIRINTLGFTFIRDNQSMVWDNYKYKEKMHILSNIWLLYKYGFKYSVIMRAIASSLYNNLGLKYNTYDDIDEELKNFKWDEIT